MRKDILFCQCICKCFNFKATHIHCHGWWRTIHHWFWLKCLVGIEGLHLIVQPSFVPGQIIFPWLFDCWSPSITVDVWRRHIGVTISYRSDCCTASNRESKRDANEGCWQVINVVPISLCSKGPCVSPSIILLTRSSCRCGVLFKGYPSASPPSLLIINISHRKPERGFTEEEKYRMYTSKKYTMYKINAFTCEIIRFYM